MVIISYSILDCNVRKLWFGRQTVGIGRKTLHDSIKFSPSPWSTQPAPLATLHWLNIFYGGLGTGRCKSSSYYFTIGPRWNLQVSLHSQTYQLSGRKVGLVKTQVTPKVSLCAGAATAVVRLLIQLTSAVFKPPSPGTSGEASLLLSFGIEV